MKVLIPTATLLLCSTLSYSQDYDRATICGTDTLDVNYYSHKYGTMAYRAFSCTKASELGIRLDMAFNTFAYNKATRNWLGNHNGAQLGISIAHGNFNIGARIKLASVSPNIALVYNGQPLGTNDRVNPVKADYDISYSHHIKYNFCVEPYLALTAHSFHVFRDTIHDPLLSKIKALSVGVTLTKYFSIKKSKNYEYFALFVRYGYGFTDFRKVHSSLGFGYQDISFGIAYKFFGRMRFYRRVD